MRAVFETALCAVFLKFGQVYEFEKAIMALHRKAVLQKQ